MKGISVWPVSHGGNGYVHRTREHFISYDNVGNSWDDWKARILKDPGNYRVIDWDEIYADIEHQGTD
jgi:hypothetical protein